MAGLKCFMTYSSDSDKHRMWVRHLALLLERSGVDINLDQLDVSPGTYLTQYVETCIRESDFILPICTPNFARKVNQRDGVVGFESQIIVGEILEGSLSPEQVVPILREGKPEESIPSYVKGKVWIDF